MILISFQLFADVFFITDRRNYIFYRHRACLTRAETVELVTLSTKQRITTAFARSKILLEKTAKTVGIADLVNANLALCKKCQNTELGKT